MLKTLVFKYSTNNESFINNYIKDWNICYRKVYNNLDLIKDQSFINEIISKIKSKKLYEYLVTEVISFNEKYDIGKENVNDKIKDLKDKTEKLNIKEFKTLKRLEKSLKSKIVFGGRFNLKRRSKGLITNQEWKKIREYPVYFTGESARNGNRFFNFDFLNGLIQT